MSMRQMYIFPFGEIRYALDRSRHRRGSTARPNAAVREAGSSEPAGAGELAGVEQAVSRGELAPDEHAVCLVTGSGFKDERSLVRMVGDEPTPLVGSFEEFANAVREAL